MRVTVSKFVKVQREYFSFDTPSSIFVVIMMKYLYIIFALICFASCSLKERSYLAFDEVQYVERFPQSFEISSSAGQEVNWNLIGIRNFIIYDTLFIVSTVEKEGLWTILSTKNLKILGSFIKRGKGPNEFVQSPNPSRSQMCKQGKSVKGKIYDTYTGKLYEMNVSESLKKGTLQMCCLNDSLPKSIFDFAILNTTDSYYCKKMVNNQTQRERYILQNGQEYIPKSFEQLNRASVYKSENLNILSTITKKHPQKDLLVEAPISFNTINLFSADGSFYKTICMEKKLYSIEEIEEIDLWERIYTYGDVRIYEHFFGVLYIGETNKDFQLGRKKDPIIRLFDWEGNPLAEIKLNRFITSFDMDLRNGYLYTMDHQTDEFYQYDIQNILVNIPTVNK